MSPPNNSSDAVASIYKRPLATVPAVRASKSLRIEEGAHEDLASGSELPFRHVKRLGLGASAVVDMVEDTSNGRVFAHKEFRPTAGAAHTLRKLFLNEVEILKRLDTHRHIVHVRWSYISGRSFGMLLSPVASDGDLDSFLSAFRDTGTLPTSEQQSILYRAYGCLANGLAYIHSHAIRHKDIKPKNILIHRGRMIYTDFGIALDGSNQSTTTTGFAGDFTRRYCAPEIVDNRPRNSLSDVFSLGCVFLEILAILVPHFTRMVSDTRPYEARLPELWQTDRLFLGWEGLRGSITTLLYLSLSMLCYRKEGRPLPQAIIAILCDSQRPFPDEFFCLSCRVSSLNATAVQKYAGGEVLREQNSVSISQVHEATTRSH